MATTKLSMRAKKLQYNVKLKVYRSEDVVLEDQSLFARSVPQVQTGVEKDEEEEHHLQRFISASQLEGPRTAFYIPTPDASQEVPYYDELYKSNYARPPKPIRVAMTIDEIATTDSYDLDEEDQRWIKSYNSVKNVRPLTEDQVEKVVTRLEQLANDRKESDAPLPNLSDLGPDTGATGEGGIAIYDFWKKKRERLSRPLLNLLRPETKPNDPDPYVCFRRRELRQTRKSRRNDQQSYERLVKLRTELDRSRSVVDLMRKRDRLKKEQLLLELLSWEVRYKIHIIELKHPELIVQQPSRKEKPRLPVHRPSRMDDGMSPMDNAHQLGHQHHQHKHLPLPSHQPVLAQHQRKVPVIPPPLPPPEPEVIVDWSRHPPPDTVLSGIDLNMNQYNRLSDAPLNNPDRPENQYIDLTHAVTFEPAEFRPRQRLHRSIEIGNYHFINTRLRMGRGGRLWIDRSTLRPARMEYIPTSSAYDSPSKFDQLSIKRPFEGSDEVSDDEEEDDAVVPRSFLSIPIVLYPPHELNTISGTGDAIRKRFNVLPEPMNGIRGANPSSAMHNANNNATTLPPRKVHKAALVGAPTASERIKTTKIVTKGTVGRPASLARVGSDSRRP